MSDDVDPYAYA